MQRKGNTISEKFKLETRKLSELTWVGRCGRRRSEIGKAEKTAIMA